MAISTRTLRSAADRTRQVLKTNSLNEALAKKQQTAFLCHSHRDHILAKGLQTLLNENGWDVYIDWQDEELPSSPDKKTAEKIKSKIAQTDWFLFLATDNSTSSRWCPWGFRWCRRCTGPGTYRRGRRSHRAFCPGSASEGL